MNRLRLQIPLQPLNATLPAVPTLLKPTERSLRTRRKRSINPHGPRLNPARNPHRPRDIARIHRAPQPILGIIRKRDSLILSFECLDADDGRHPMQRVRQQLEATQMLAESSVVPTKGPPWEALL